LKTHWAKTARIAEWMQFRKSLDHVMGMTAINRLFGFVKEMS